MNTYMSDTHIYLPINCFKIANILNTNQRKSKNKLFSDRFARN